MNRQDSCVDRPRTGRDQASERFHGPISTFDDQVPVDLRARWASADRDQVLVNDFLRSMLNAGAAVLLVAGVAGLLAGWGRLPVLAACAALGILGLLGAGQWHRAERRRPGRFSAEEIDLLLAHGRDITAEDWAVAPGEPGAPEAVLARTARDVAARLNALPAWSSIHLADHRVRLDPMKEAMDINIAAGEIYHQRLRAAREVSGVQGPLSPELHAAQQEWAGRLQESLAAVEARLDAFVAYADELLDLAVLIDQHEAAGRLHKQLDSQGADMSVRAAGQELAAAELVRLRLELTELRAGLNPGLW